MSVYDRVPSTAWLSTTSPQINDAVKKCEAVLGGGICARTTRSSAPTKSSSTLFFPNSLISHTSSYLIIAHDTPFPQTRLIPTLQPARQSPTSSLQPLPLPLPSDPSIRAPPSPTHPYIRHQIHGYPSHPKQQCLNELYRSIALISASITPPPGRTHEPSTPAPDLPAAHVGTCTAKQSDFLGPVVLVRGVAAGEFILRVSRIFSASLIPHYNQVERTNHSHQRQIYCGMAGIVHLPRGWTTFRSRSPGSGALRLVSAFLECPAYLGVDISTGSNARILRTSYKIENGVVATCIARKYSTFRNQRFQSEAFAAGEFIPRVSRMSGRR